MVRRLQESGISVRVASRHPDRSRAIFDANATKLQFVRADVQDDGEVRAALAGCDGAVNAISLYAEQGSTTFESIHVQAARRIAQLARETGMQRFVHISGIGSDPNSSSKYISARGQGELVVKAAFPNAKRLRPAVMFGPDDRFLKPLSVLISRLPIFPMFGKGETRLQPAFVGDVAHAIADLMQTPDTKANAVECAGPDIYAYKELLEIVADAMRKRVQFVPMPFAAWYALARISSWLPNPQVTRTQVELMEIDNVASSKTPGFSELGIRPTSVKDVLPKIICGS